MASVLTSRLSPSARSWLSWALWMLIAIALAIGMVSFVGRSYQVHGISMEPTLRSGDIVFGNKLGPTLARLTGKAYVPKRGVLVVFKNPFYGQGDPQAFVVKRVVGLPGDRVVVRDGRITIYPNHDLSKGFDPNDGITGPQSPTSGTVDRIVPDDELFVAGDNRLGKNSLDSRNGMSTVPLAQIEGKVILRFWPFNNFRLF